MALATELPPMYEAPKLRSGVRRRLDTWAISFEMVALQRRGLRFRLAARTLARTGIVVIRGAASPEAVAGLAALVESDAPVINFRHGEDNGMMDIFHPENFHPEQRQPLLNCLHEELVGELAARAFGMQLEVTCRNLYVNRGVENTRYFHCDGERVKVKSFVYLCDVQSLDVGPYCYVQDPHRNQALRRRNQTFNQQHGLNKHEYRKLHGCAGLPVFCRAGDMVVSARNGAHRGYPQTPTAQRAVLVNVYEPARVSA